MKKYSLILIVLLVSVGFTANHYYYPIDGYEYTGIKRLKHLELIKSGEIKGDIKLPEGALKSWSEIQLNLTSRKSDSVGALLVEDEKFQSEIETVFRGLPRSYSLTVVDMSNPDSLRYASRNETAGYQPGSVGKLAVLTGFFSELAKIYPDSFEKRIELLKNKSVKAGQWALSDEHTIPVYNIEKKTFVKRRVVAGDVFTLYEWLDNMVSVSNNGAASVVYREVLLMAAFGDKYPDLSQEETDAYFKETERKLLTDLGNDVVNLPLRDLGITEDEWRLGGFFTRGADSYVGRKGGSIGTPLGLMKWLVQLEQGNIVDERSSLEMKRLIYLTDRRIRYAQSPTLNDAAVYFKSGSLYKCDRSKGEACGKYEGNVSNFMNSVIIVEHPDNCKYMVVLMTNVLRKNSAYDHLTLAGNIDKVIRK